MPWMKLNRLGLQTVYNLFSWDFYVSVLTHIAYISKLTGKHCDEMGIKSEEHQENSQKINHISLNVVHSNGSENCEWAM